MNYDGCASSSLRDNVHCASIYGNAAPRVGCVGWTRSLLFFNIPTNTRLLVLVVNHRRLRFWFVKYFVFVVCYHELGLDVVNLVRGQTQSWELNIMHCLHSEMVVLTGSKRLLAMLLIVFRKTTHFQDPISFQPINRNMFIQHICFMKRKRVLFETSFRAKYE